MKNLQISIHFGCVQNLLLVLKINSLRHVHYRFSVNHLSSSKCWNTACIVAVHMKSSLQSIEDRERNKKGERTGTEATNFCRDGQGIQGKGGWIASASGGGRARLSRAKNAGEKREPSVESRARMVNSCRCL